MWNTGSLRSIRHVQILQNQKPEDRLGINTRQHRLQCHHSHGTEQQIIRKDMSAQRRCPLMRVEA
eukprot:4259806-Amphidinium_carterae.2